MIAKIGHGSKIYGALVYNINKVLDSKGEILHLNNMLETADGKYTAIQLMSSFIPYLAANKKTEKTAIHISLNPDPNDHVANETYIELAKEYMEKMGYGEQPFVVFKHNDIDRSHIHIVSTTVDKNGKKIPDSFEKKKSMEICRELENKYNLTPATEKQRTADTSIFHPVDYKKLNIKSQIASVVRYLPKYYQFQTLGSYNALLSLFNITVEHIKKERDGEIKEGLIYFALDENGNKTSNPFKASLFGKQAGLAALRSHFEKSKNVAPEIKSRTAEILAQAMRMNNDEQSFKNYLIQEGINTIVRRNEEGRLYGITFVDHNTFNVYNGSQLGKQFTANKFNEHFSKGRSEVDLKIEKKNTLDVTPTKTNVIREELHPLFDFMMDATEIIGDWGIMDTLLLDTLAEDPNEYEFERQMKKKKKRKRGLN